MARSSRGKILLAFLGAAILCGCSKSEGVNPLPDTLTITQTTNLSAVQIRTVQTAVKANLDNPKTARFGGIAAGISNTGAIHVCGLVSTKEPDGSYTRAVYSGEFEGGAFKFDGLGNSLELMCEQQGLTPER
jgi:hypothetical protein